jgi:hypothetical protein
MFWSIVNTHLTWRNNSVLNHIAGCLKSAFVGKSRVELYCDLNGLQAPDGGSIPADITVQAQRPDLVILDRSVHGRHRIALIKLTCLWDTDARPRTSKLLSVMKGGTVVCISSRLEHEVIFSIQLRTNFGHFFRARVPAGHWSGIGQDFSRVFVFHIPGAH